MAKKKKGAKMESKAVRGRRPGAPLKGDWGGPRKITLCFDEHTKNMVWYTRITQGGHTTKETFTHDYTESKRMFQEFCADVRSGRRVIFADPVAGPRLNFLRDEFLKYISLHKAPATYQQYASLLKVFCVEHGLRYAKHITVVDVDAEIERLRALGRKPWTLKHTVKVIKAMFNWGVKRKYLDANPAQEAENPATPSGKTRFLTDAEAAKLLAASPGILGEMIAVYLDTGMRLSELANLTAGNLDFEQGRITIWEHKTSTTAREPNPRRIPMTQRVREIMRRHCEAAADLSDPQAVLFKNEADKPFDRHTLRRRFDRSKVKADLADVTIHTLRHTFGSRMVMVGVDLRTVAELMGHSTARTTELYAHLTQRHLQKAIERLEAAHTGQREGRKGEEGMEADDPRYQEWLRSLKAGKESDSEKPGGSETGGDQGERGEDRAEGQKSGGKAAR